MSKSHIIAVLFRFVCIYLVPYHRDLTDCIPVLIQEIIDEWSSESSIDIRILTLFCSYSRSSFASSYHCIRFIVITLRSVCRLVWVSIHERVVDASISRRVFSITSLVQRRNEEWHIEESNVWNSPSRYKSVDVCSSVKEITTGTHRFYCANGFLFIFQRDLSSSYLAYWQLQLIKFLRIIFESI